MSQLWFLFNLSVQMHDESQAVNQKINEQRQKTFFPLLLNLMMMIDFVYIVTNNTYSLGH